MTTFSATTTLTDESKAKRLAEALEQVSPEPYGVGCFEIEDDSGEWEVAAYFMDRPDDIALTLAAAAFDARDFVISEIGERDWVSEVRRELKPVRAGRFIVHGSHDRDAASDARHALEIEAAMAFGTGHHGTTRGCLNALDKLAKMGFQPKRVADIGCGTGVLAMAAASLWKLRCVASDIDPVAVATAKANFRANGLSFGGRLTRAAGFRSDVVRQGGPYHLIFANILANPLKRLAPDMARNTAPGGVVVLSGVLNEQRAGVEAVYLGNGFSRLWISRDGEWSTLILRRN